MNNDTRYSGNGTLHFQIVERRDIHRMTTFPESDYQYLCQNCHRLSWKLAQLSNPPGRTKPFPVDPTTASLVNSVPAWASREKLEESINQAFFQTWAQMHILDSGDDEIEDRPVSTYLDGPIDWEEEATLEDDEYRQARISACPSCNSERLKLVQTIGPVTAAEIIISGPSSWEGSLDTTVHHDTNKPLDLETVSAGSGMWCRGKGIITSSTMMAVYAGREITLPPPDAVGPAGDYNIKTTIPTKPATPSSLYHYQFVVQGELEWLEP